MWILLAAIISKEFIDPYSQYFDRLTGHELAWEKDGRRERTTQKLIFYFEHQ
jgi:hypothetical protein